VDNYEYELPSDFEDEEIDEDMAFTAEDKKLYAGWFGDDEADHAAAGGEGSDEDDGQQQRRSKRSKLGEFADLESSSEEEQDGDDDEVRQDAITAVASFLFKLLDVFCLHCSSLEKHAIALW
jgi:U3 small nucleolar RNA-associated protein 14